MAVVMYESSEDVEAESKRRAAITVRNLLVVLVARLTDYRMFLNRTMTLEDFIAACKISKSLCRRLISGEIVFTGKQVVLAKDLRRKIENESESIQRGKRPELPPAKSLPEANCGDGGSDDPGGPGRDNKYYQILSKIPLIDMLTFDVKKYPVGRCDEDTAGSALKRYAKELDLKQTELAYITDINDGEISNIFTGKSEKSTKKIIALVIALRLWYERAIYVLEKIGFDIHISSEEGRLMCGYIFSSPYYDYVTVRWCNAQLKAKGFRSLVETQPDKFTG